MHSLYRHRFNSAFSSDSYRNFVSVLEKEFPGSLDFRIAESPVFIDKAFQRKLIAACDDIIAEISRPDFKNTTERAIPSHQYVPRENDHTSFIAIDFAVCRGNDGELEPQLIELQGFPSVFGYQLFLSELFKKRYGLGSPLFYNFIDPNRQYETYINALNSVIVGDENPENVILLEVRPERQKTRIDFAFTERFWGVKTVCVSEVLKEGKSLYYQVEGRKIPIRRIYNRVIFDDLQQNADLTPEFQLTDDVDVTWVGHPNWFFRISKYMLPLLSGPFFPPTKYLSDYRGSFPTDLKNYVLKPLFSFAGSGVVLHVTRDLLEGIKDPENYILQRKVDYAPVIETTDGSKVKAEIRMLYIWPDSLKKPILVTALSRLSRGEMIGVRFNKDVTWVGGSAVFFEQ